MNSPVEKIKERLSIEEVVSSYIKLEKAGNNLKARCPFHNEKTPSFFVSPDRGSFYCFGCGASGDIFTFVETFEGLDFKGALKLLADRAGVPLQAFSKENKEAESEKEKLYRIMEEAVKFFESNLAKNPEALNYLKSRGLNEKSIKEFRIGFAILDWRLLYDYLKEKSLPAGRQGFKDIELEKAGLVKKTDKGYYDRFRGRIMFPLSDSSGRVVAFSGRIFVDDGKSAKYLNSPETTIFTKSVILYGLDKAKESIRKNNFSILVEGQMDLVLSHQAGYKNTVATSGTALSDSEFSKENVVSNLGLIRRLSPNIVLAFDGDKAGFNAANRAARIALSLGMDVKVANLPEGVDPADLISKNGIDAWREVIRNSKHIIEFLLDKILKNYPEDARNARLDSARQAGREIKEKVLPYVNALESSIEQAHFLKKVSELSGIPPSALEEDFKKITEDLKHEKKEILEAGEVLVKIYRKDYILRRLLGIVFWQQTLKETNIEIEKVLKELADILKATPKEILEKHVNNREDLIFEAEVFYGAGADLEKDTAEMLGNLREELLKEELEGKMRELHLAEEAKDAPRSAKILKEIQDLNNKLQEIKTGRLKHY